MGSPIRRHTYLPYLPYPTYLTDLTSSEVEPNA